MRFLLRMLIGIPISFLILVFAVGGIEDAAALMFLSIVCTAGISLVIWVPCWWLLGASVVAVGTAVGLVSPAKAPPKILPQQERDMQALVSYLRAVQAHGLSLEQVRSNLEQVGWSQAMIDQAASQVPASLPPGSQPFAG